MKNIGLLGAGQLASLIAASLVKLDVVISVYAKELNEPACCYAKYIQLGQMNDFSRLEEFFNFCDIVILESEFFDLELLKKLEAKTQTKIFPELSAYEKLCTKNRQKEFFKKCKVPFAKTSTVLNEEDTSTLVAPVMLKHSFGSYDGYGNLLIKDQGKVSDLIREFSQNFSKQVLVEKYLDIKNEYACMLIKSKEQSYILSPVKTHQENNICHLVSFPAKIGKEQEKKIYSYMQLIDENLCGQGVFAFEFFETMEGEILINEAAPRVHNSYHFSIEGMNYSQFDLMAYIALGRELPKVQSLYSNIVMINILGQAQGENYSLTLPELEQPLEFKIHLYGKKESRVGRKLGHITLYGDKPVLEIAKYISSEYKI